MDKTRTIARVVLLLAAAIAAPSRAGEESGAVVGPVSPEVLEHYIWQLSDAHSAANERLAVYFPVNGQSRLALHFEGNSLSARGGCNGFNEGYALVGGRLTNRTDSLATRTALGCSPTSLEKMDDAVLDFLMAGPVVHVTGTSATPHLHLQSLTGEQLDFVGVATARSHYGSAGDVVHVEIDQDPIGCRHAGHASNCLRLREIDDRGTMGQHTGVGDWVTLTAGIEGLQNVPEMPTDFFVRRFQVAASGSDAPRFVYVEMDR